MGNSCTKNRDAIATISKRGEKPPIITKMMSEESMSRPNMVEIDFVSFLDQIVAGKTFTEE